MTQILIEPVELKEMMLNQDIVIVDTRSPEEYKECHIEGAVNIHDIFTFLASSTPEGIAEMRTFFASSFEKVGISETTQTIFYEGGMGTGYGQSCRGHFILSYLGNENSYILHGGLKAWTNAGFAMTDTIPAPKKSTFNASNTNIAMVVGKEDVLAEIGKDRVTLLDVRDVDEWIGKSSSPYGTDFAPRKGRIPGAKWLEWYRMMKPDGDISRIKDADEIRAEVQNIGMDTDKPIWLYCFKGARTSNSYVALKQAGFKNIATYFGSWNEWANDPDLPIETGFPSN